MFFNHMFTEMLGAHQGEHLVTLSDQQIVAEPGDNTFHGAASSLRNDRRIIDGACVLVIYNIT